MTRKIDKVQINLGDVFEINIDGGFAYAQIINFSPDKIEYIRVFFGTYAEPQDVHTVVNSKEQFQCFMNLSYLLGDNEYCNKMYVVGNVPIPDKIKGFPLFKSSNDWGSGRVTWHLRYFDERVFPDNECVDCRMLINGKWIGSIAKNLKKLGEELPLEYYECPNAQDICYEELLERIKTSSTNSFDILYLKKYNQMYTYKEEKTEEKQKNVSDVIHLLEPHKKSESVALHNNPLKSVLVKLLNNMDSIAKKYEELFDTEAREARFTAVYLGFIQMNKEYELPTDFKMFTKSGDKRVRTALASFIKDAQLLVEKGNFLQTAQNRLDAFQDNRILSKNDNTFDEYFGHLESIEQFEKLCLLSLS